MPLLKIQTNAACPAERRGELLKQISASVADMLGKPERYVMVSLEVTPHMLFAGEETGPIDYGAVPAACFTTPELAYAGATEQRLREQGVEYLSAAVPYTSAAKGRALKEEHGLCKFLLDPDGRILGCHIVGEHASILLQ